MPKLLEQVREQMRTYKNVLNIDLAKLENVARAKKPLRVPDGLHACEIKSVLSHLTHTNWLMASLLFG